MGPEDTLRGQLTADSLQNSLLTRCQLLAEELQPIVGDRTGRGGRLPGQIDGGGGDVAGHQRAGRGGQLGETGCRLQGHARTRGRLLCQAKGQRPKASYSP